VKLTILFVSSGFIISITIFVGFPSTSSSGVAAFLSFLAFGSSSSVSIGEVSSNRYLLEIYSGTPSVYLPSVEKVPSFTKNFLYP